MNKFLFGFFIILLITTLVFLCYFYIYLYKQYEKVSINFYKRNEKLNKYRRTIKKHSTRELIKDNVTKLINSDSINNRVGYAVIEILDEQGRVEKTQTIFKPNFSIGREDSNDMVLSKETISRRHCLILYQEKKFYICNLSETNPTMLNGVSIDNSPENCYPLKFGNIIEMAGYSLRFKDIIKT